MIARGHARHHYLFLQRVAKAPQLLAPLLGET